jgi:hypothetical protein
MWFPSWLRTHNPAATCGYDRPRRPSAKPAGFRPRLEALEGRDVPSTLTVTNTLDTGIAGDGSLRGEIAAAAQSGDTIQFAIPTTDRGYNPLTGAFTITLAQGELPITKNLTIQGPGADRLTISGGGFSAPDYGSRVFEIDGAATAVNLSGLSITGGTGLHYTYHIEGGIGWGGGGQTGGSGFASDGQGGAIWNGGVLNVTGCTLSNNSVDANPTFLLNPTFSFSGGAIYNAGTLTVSNSTLSKNAAGDAYWSSGGSWGSGGAIFNAGALTVNNSSLSDNAAYGSSSGAVYSFSNPGVGGAIDNFGSLSVSGGTLSDNSAYFGGAVFSGYKTSAALTGVTLAGNTAYDGGAVWNDGTMTLSGCSVDGNTASDAGGGIYSAKAGHLTMQSKSTVAGNAAAAGADLYTFGTTKISKDSTVGVTGP